MTKKSPFKFLDSFTKDDREIFFGRNKEIEELHTRVFESKILLVYGTSGTGKSSLINCGLANRFSDSDWLPINVRRGTDINRSLFDALSKSSLTRAPFDKINAAGSTKYNLEKLLRSVYLDHFRPVFLIFDQFEELFIFGSSEERQELIKNVAKVVGSDIQCRFIFSMREEYLAGVTEFEREIPSFLSNRIRIEKMTRQNAVETIEGPCRINNIQVEAGFAEALLEKLNPDTPEVELTWLQIFLDKIMKLAEDEDHEVNKFTLGLIDKAGEVKDILGTFLEEQISQLSDAEAGLVVLKSFVSVKGTKHQITEEEVIEYSGTFGKEIDNETVKELIQRFIRLRILRDKSEDGKYELRHDSLASKIYEKITIVEKELLEVKYFIENAYSNYVKRELLLSDEDLKYIAPYEDKLFLNEKSLRFIADSKQAIHRARRRKLNIAIAAVSIIIVILSLFSIWAMKSRRNAIILRQMALEQKDAAVRSKVEADSAKQVALLSQLQAEENAKLAMAARNQSEEARKDAIIARGNALQQKSIAEKMSAVASEQAKKAEEEKQIAEQQKILAQAAEEKAKRLSLLSTAQNLALKSVSIPMNPQLMGLLAVQAFNFNKNNGGAIDDPVIWQALDKAYNTIDGSKHTVFQGSENEIRSLAEDEHGLLSADMDGNILHWNEIGNDSIIANSRKSSYINFISLSPAGDKLITCYEDNRLILKSLVQYNNEFDLKGHISPIITAAWSENGDLLATGGKDSLIIIWNTNIQPASGLKTFKATSSIKFLTFCGNDTIISIHDNGSINLWELNKDSCNLLYISKQARPVCAAWQRPSKFLVTGCDDGTIIFSHLNRKFPQSVEIVGYNSGIHQLAFNHDFTLLAMVTWDKVIRLFNFEEYFFRDDNIGAGINIDDLTVSTRSLIFTNDNRLVAGMSDKSIRIWITSSRELASLICNMVKRDMTDQEWRALVGSDIPYEKTCGSNSLQPGEK
jgi:WD40 repeat protein